ncbi:MAG: FtsQ-type POTRA domain-containing protein [Candidatus Komeilibacteria bacterium]|nr:FtsQ-type POTRA domain-containing protein [Candidatus Komeilibacteria bacterium]
MKNRTLRAHERIFQPPKQTLIPKLKHGPGERRALVYRDHYARAPVRSSALKRTLIGIAVALVAQGFFQVPLFQLRAVTVSGLEYIPEDSIRPFIASELQLRRFLIFRNDNYFLFAENRFKKNLESNFFVNVISVKKDFPHGLVLSLSERISPFVVQTPENYIELDTSGTAIGAVDAPRERQSVIADERSDRSGPITREYLERITAIKKQWEHDLPGIVIEKFHYTDDTAIIILSTDKGFRVFFDPTEDTAKQLVRLELFLADTSLKQPREYVDLRFDESLYIK